MNGKFDKLARHVAKAAAPTVRLGQCGFNTSQEIRSKSFPLTKEVDHCEHRTLGTITSEPFVEDAPRVRDVDIQKLQRVLIFRRHTSQTAKRWFTGYLQIATFVYDCNWREERRSAARSSICQEGILLTVEAGWSLSDCILRVSMRRWVRLPFALQIGLAHQPPSQKQCDERDIGHLLEADDLH